MPNVTPAQIVAHLLEKEGFPQEVISKVESIIDDNDPKKAEQFAQDRAIRQMQSEKFAERFPDSKRLGGS